MVETARVTSRIDDFIRETSGQAPVTKSAPRRTRVIILDHLAVASTEWSEFIGCTDSSPFALAEQEAVKRDATPEELARLLGQAYITDSHSQPQRKVMTIKADSKVLHLFKCSWCGNPSAVLRKCGVCGQACYCDQQWYFCLIFLRTMLGLR